MAVLKCAAILEALLKRYSANKHLEVAGKGRM